MAKTLGLGVKRHRLRYASPPTKKEHTSHKLAPPKEVAPAWRPRFHLCLRAWLGKAHQAEGSQAAYLRAGGVSSCVWPGPPKFSQIQTTSAN